MRRTRDMAPLLAHLRGARDLSRGYSAVVCGRYAVSRDPDALVEEFEVVDNHAADARVSFNVAPASTSAVVLTRVPKDEPCRGPVRQLRLLTWGLVPSWAKERGVGVRMINARSEDVFERSAFRRPILARRCLVPATGWYEWQRGTDPATGEKIRQPFFMHRSDGTCVALAGLYEFWRDPGVAAADDPAAWVSSFTILTRAAEAGLDQIHHRMPLVLEREDWARWLSPEVTARAPVEAILRRSQTIAAGRFERYAVAAEVNNARHDGPQLLQPVG